MLAAGGVWGAREGVLGVEDLLNKLEDSLHERLLILTCIENGHPVENEVWRVRLLTQMLHIEKVGQKRLPGIIQQTAIEQCLQEIIGVL